MTHDTATRTHPARFSPAGAGLPAPAHHYACGHSEPRKAGALWKRGQPIKCLKCAQAGRDYPMHVLRNTATGTKKKPKPVPVAESVDFLAPVRAWKQMAFVSQIHVDPKTKRFESEFQTGRRVAAEGRLAE